MGDMEPDRSMAEILENMPSEELFGFDLGVLYSTDRWGDGELVVSEMRKRAPLMMAAMANGSLVLPVSEFWAGLTQELEKLYIFIRNAPHDVFNITAEEADAAAHVELDTSDEEELDLIPQPAHHAPEAALQIMSLELAHVHAELHQMAAEEMEMLPGAPEEAVDREPEGEPREEDPEADPAVPQN